MNNQKKIVKQTVKKILPPIIFDLLKFLRQLYRKPINSYYGMYKNFEECRRENIKASSFNNINYAQFSMQKTEAYLNRPIEMEYERTKDLKFLIYVQYLLGRFGHLRIFDFGGGVGWHYIKLRKYIKNFNKECLNIQYTICENPEVACIGKEYFRNRDFGKVKFVTELFSRSNQFDLCILSSVLHYIEDYKGLLKGICSYNPKALFISRLPAGDLDETVTLQTIEESSFPCYIFNWTNFKNILFNLGYLIYDEWDEFESFFLDFGGNKIVLPNYKGAFFLSKNWS